MSVTRHSFRGGHRFRIRTPAFMLDGVENHSGGNGRVGHRIDQNATAGDAILAIGIEIQRLGGFDSQAVQWLRFGERLAATDAAEAAHFTVTVTEFGEVFGFTEAAYAVQLAFLGKKSYR